MEQQREAIRITLRLPPRVDQWVRQSAREKGISANAHINLTLQEKMEAEQNATA